MTIKEGKILERIDQKLDDLIVSFEKVEKKVDCHEIEINKAKGVVWAVGGLAGFIGTLIGHFWGKK